MFNRLTLSILACCGLLLLASNDERSPVVAEQPKATEAPAAAPPSTPWLKNVYPIKAGESNGTAVAIAPDTLLSVDHVTKSGNGWAFVAIDRKWVVAKTVSLESLGYKDHDGSILKLTGVTLPTMQTREPEYRENVTVFGARTKKKMRGIVVRADMASLDSTEDGVDSGDSGGAVVGDDGRLIGLVRAYDGDRKTGNRRVVYFTPAVIYPKEFAEKTAKATAPKATQNCPGGVCRQQPQFQFQRSR